MNTACKFLKSGICNECLENTVVWILWQNWIDFVTEVIHLDFEVTEAGMQNVEHFNQIELELDVIWRTCVGLLTNELHNWNHICPKVINCIADHQEL